MINHLHHTTPQKLESADQYTHDTSIASSNTVTNDALNDTQTNNSGNQNTQLDKWSDALHCGDATELLGQMPLSSVDCVVTSPPYWGLRSYDHDAQLGFESSIEAYVANISDVFTTTKRVLKPTGSCFVIVGDQYQSTAPGTQNTTSNLNEKTGTAQGTHFRFDAGLPAKSLMGLPERLIQQFLDAGWLLRNKIVWRKPNPMPEPSATDRFTQAWENVLFFTQKQQYYFDADAAETHDVWEFPTATLDTVHPAPFPKELCKRIIRAACPPDGLVLDPFCGSGTTCAAAMELGRHYIGIDLNETYLRDAQTRLHTTVHGADSESSSHTNNTTGKSSYPDNTVLTPQQQQLTDFN